MVSDSTPTPTSVAVACQGGGSHTAYTAGALMTILEERPRRYDVTALSGTSGGAMCAALAWDGLRRGDEAGAVDRLEGFWDELSARTPWAQAANAWTLWTARMTAEFGSFGLSPYHHTASETARDDLAAAVERFVDFDDGAPAAPPHLFVGAVDVESGDFEVFTDGEHGVDALLASAAVPTLFRAVEIDGRRYWDGLFSQNPPIRHFTSEVPADEKPDEIWLVRINPVATDATPQSLADIADRRNELAGNLSLEQELHMIESVNDLVDAGVIDDPAYKHIAVREITLAAPLDVHSKLDRSPEFIADLIERGRRDARQFWRSTDRQASAVTA